MFVYVSICVSLSVHMRMINDIRCFVSVSFFPSPSPQPCNQGRHTLNGPLNRVCLDRWKR